MGRKWHLRVGADRSACGQGLRVTSDHRKVTCPDCASTLAMADAEAVAVLVKPNKKWTTHRKARP